MPGRGGNALKGVAFVVVTTLSFALADVLTKHLTAAYAGAPAGLLAPVNCLQLVWAAILGGLVFHHWPTPLSVVGMAMVVAAGAVTAWRAQVSRLAA